MPTVCEPCPGKTKARVIVYESSDWSERQRRHEPVGPAAQLPVDDLLIVLRRLDLLRHGVVAVGADLADFPFEHLRGRGVGRGRVGHCGTRGGNAEQGPRRIAIDGKTAGDEAGAEHDEDQAWHWSVLPPLAIHGPHRGCKAALAARKLALFWYRYTSHT